MQYNSARKKSIGSAWHISTSMHCSSEIKQTMNLKNWSTYCKNIIYIHLSYSQNMSLSMQYLYFSTWLYCALFHNFCVTCNQWLIKLFIVHIFASRHPNYSATPSAKLHSPTQAILLAIKKSFMTAISFASTANKTTTVSSCEWNRHHAPTLQFVTLHLSEGVRKSQSVENSKF